MIESSSDFKNGAADANADAHLTLVNHPHDMIKFSQNPANSNFDEFYRLYQKGLSLREVSEETGFPLSTVRDVLTSNKIPLRANNKTTADDPKKPQRAFWGAIPYGYTVLDGQVVVDPKEIKIVRKILTYYQKCKSFNATAIWLNSQKIPSKLGKRWSDKTIASIVRKHKNVIEITKGDTNGTR